MLALLGTMIGLLQTSTDTVCGESPPSPQETSDSFCAKACASIVSPDRSECRDEYNFFVRYTTDGIYYTSCLEDCKKKAQDEPHCFQQIRSWWFVAIQTLDPMQWTLACTGNNNCDNIAGDRIDCLECQVSMHCTPTAPPEPYPDPDDPWLSG